MMEWYWYIIIPAMSFLGGISYYLPKLYKLKKEIRRLDREIDKLERERWK